MTESSRLPRIRIKRRGSDTYLERVLDGRLPEKSIRRSMMSSVLTSIRARLTAMRMALRRSLRSGRDGGCSATPRMVLASLSGWNVG